VSRVACGTDFSACITVKGHLYTWGTNRWGNLGVESSNNDTEGQMVNNPTMVKSLVNKFITQVACGSKHMMCLTSEKSVYSWGSGENGILGHGNTSGLNKPQLIKELKAEEIIFIAAGDFVSGAISIKGHLFVWGRGKYGVLGIGSEENVSIPKRVDDNSIADEKIFFVSLGLYHTLCCTGKNSIIKI
jgi:alpha-tubulin suppressor-like RCC1 family protein